MRKRCPFCHAEMDIPEKVGEAGYCRCGAYGLVGLLTDARFFREKAKKALGIDVTTVEKFMGVVDGGTVFEMNGEPVIIQWARQPRASP